MIERTFPVPDLGEGLIEATVLEWAVSVGDQVERGDPLVEVETTKSAIEIPSPVSGVVSVLHGSPGETIAVGRPLVDFTVSDDEAGIVGTVPSHAQPRRRVRLHKRE